MWVAIKIPDEYAKYYKSITVNNEGWVLNVGRGIPLPSGRLIDAGAYEQSVKKHYFDNDAVVRCTEIALANAPTVLETKESE